jgi:hypothetical protein
MGIALAYPEGEKGGRGKLSQNRESLSKAEMNAISQARFVLRHCRDKADNFPTVVIPGDPSCRRMIPRCFWQRGV